jgi:hypothetical protein
MISANLMTEKPISGRYLELPFTCSSKTNAWVLFSGEGFAPWIGIFGDGSVSFFSGIARFNGTEIFLIIAGGQGYIVDAREKRLLRQTSWSYSYSCCTVPDCSFVLVADTQEVWACSIDNDVFARARVKETWFKSFDKHGNRIPPSPKEFYEIALDGIILECVTNISASGKAWWGEDWHSFKIDLKDMSALVEDKIISAQYHAFTALPDVGGYPLSQEYANRMASYRIQ